MPNNSYWRSSFGREAKFVDHTGIRHSSLLASGAETTALRPTEAKPQYITADEIKKIINDTNQKGPIFKDHWIDGNDPYVAEALREAASFGKLKGANFANCVLLSLEIVGVDFCKASFNDALIVRCDFALSSFVECSFRRTLCIGTNFRGCEFLRSNHYESKLIDCDFCSILVEDLTELELPIGDLDSMSLNVKRTFEPSHDDEAPASKILRTFKAIRTKFDGVDFGRSTIIGVGFEGVLIATRMYLDESFVCADFGPCTPSSLMWVKFKDGLLNISAEGPSEDGHDAGSNDRAYRRSYEYSPESISVHIENCYAWGATLYSTNFAKCQIENLNLSRSRFAESKLIDCDVTKLTMTKSIIGTPSGALREVERKAQQMLGNPVSSLELLQKFLGSEGEGDVSASYQRERDALLFWNRTLFHFNIPTDLDAKADVNRHVNRIGENVEPVRFLGNELETNVIANSDWSDAQLTGCKFEDIDVVAFTSTNAIWRQVDFDSVRFNKAQFVSCKHEKGARKIDARTATRFDQCNFRQVGFTETEFDYCAFSLSRFIGAPLRQACIQHTDLSTAKGLSTDVLKGADLYGATLPEDAKIFPPLDTIAILTQQARTLFLILWLTIFYSILAAFEIFDGRDTGELGEINLPIFETKIPPDLFAFVAPVALATVFVYLHTRMAHIWEEAERLPRTFPDGRSVGSYVYPWLFSSLLRSSDFIRENNSLRGSSPLMTFEQWGSRAVGWWVPPLLTVCILWLVAKPLSQPFPGFLYLLFPAFMSIVAILTFSQPLQVLDDRKSGLWKVIFTRIGFSVMLLPIALGLYVELGSGARIAKTLEGANSGNLFAKILGEARVDISNLVVLNDESTIDLSRRSLLYINAAKLNARDANFSSAHLRWGSFAEAKLLSANFQQANLANASFSGASLVDSHFAGANLKNTNFDGADLTGADFIGAVGLTTDQLVNACGSSLTRVPNFVRRPPPCQDMIN